MEQVTLVDFGFEIGPYRPITLTDYLTVFTPPETVQTELSQFKLKKKFKSIFRKR